MKKVTIIILVFFLLFHFEGCKSFSKNAYKKEPEYVQISDKIILDTAKELKNEKNLQIIGTGGSLMHNVKRLEMGFKSNQNDTIVQGRELIIYCTKIFLSNINSNLSIRPYLDSFPFQPYDITINIYFENIQKESLNNVTAITLSSGKIIYYVSDKEEILKTIYKETYEEALKIVEAE